MTALLIEAGALTARWLNPPAPDATRAERDEHALILAVDHAVQACDDTRLTALTAGADWRTVGALVETWERLVDLDAGDVEAAWWQDPDDVDRDAVEAFEDALAQVMDGGR